MAELLFVMLFGSFLVSGLGSRSSKNNKKPNNAEKLLEYPQEMGVQERRKITAEMITKAQSEASFLPKHVHVAFVGNRGVGKSSLINSLLGFTPGDTGAAEVGAVKTTTSRGRYVSEKHPGYIWYDIPGVGTEDTTASQYYYDQSLFIYDKISDIEIVRLCVLRKQPFVLVRTKSDQHIRNYSDDFELSLDDARSRYLEDARRDANTPRDFGAARFIVTDHLVTNKMICGHYRSDSGPKDPANSRIDEAEFLRKLGIISSLVTDSGQYPTKCA